jgi:hypothetical protein
MAFSDTFKDMEGAFVKRVSSGPFSRFASLYQVYEEPTDNEGVSNAMLEKQSSRSTDTTFNDAMSQVIQSYNQSMRQAPTMQSYNPVTPNRVIVRR